MLTNTVRVLYEYNKVQYSTVHYNYEYITVQDSTRTLERR